MRIISDLTHQEYKTVAECEKAEAEFNRKKAEQEAAAKKLADNRKARATEVEKALENMRAAEKKYHDLLAAFVKDYGSFHYSFTDEKDSPFPITLSLFDLL